MAAAIVLTADVDRLRVGVELSGFAPDGPAEVVRVHPDGSRWPVRGMSLVSGGVAFGWDYEAPLNVPVTYVSRGVVTSGSVTLAVDVCGTLSVPGLPSLAGDFTIVAKPSRARGRASTALEAIGRVNPVILTDVLSAPAMTITVRTKTDADAARLEGIVEAAPTLLLRLPGTRQPWCYVSVSGLSEDPVVHYRPEAGAGVEDVARWSSWTLACRVTDPPVGDIYGDPTSTWQALYDRTLTWQQLYDSGATWLDVLAGRY